ncbi:MAG TPA: cytochrome c oxidase subunit 3 [Methylomirabilota bacterium]|jgi:heme/copper-type cytochrome/quinol oxidase subunit 3|nr:cytochrome c oxidase subunit 3 [Methylomirabilota bacterium]
MPIIEPDLQRRVGGPPSRELGRDWQPPVPPPRGNGDDGGSGPEAYPPYSNARLGMLMLLTGETVLFGGLVAAFLVLRLGASVWPPPGQPRLPVGVTAVNTLVLIGSSYTLARALRAVRQGDQRGLVRGLARTAGLGALFLAVQGAEWIRLVGFGLTASSGIYGGTFYTLIGTHGAHVLGALTWLLIVLAWAARGRYTPREYVSLATCAMYWHFVVALWPILYILVYLV